MRRGFWLVLLLVTSAMTLACAEIFLRLAWTNPYVVVAPRPGADFVALQRPHQRFVYDVRGVYEGADYVLFRTGPHGEVVGPARPGLPVAWFFGGSTTESRYVREGVRWPDLIEGVSPVNYGQSAKAVPDTYFNLKYLLTIQEPPADVFVMHAINDLAKRERFTLREWPALPFNVEPPRPLIFTTSSVAAFARVIGVHLHARVFGETRLAAILASGMEESKAPLITPAEFERVVADEMPRFYDERAAIIADLVALARRHGVRVTFLTQPDAYLPGYRPVNGRDFRGSIRLRGQSLTVEQSRRILDLVNAHTKRVAPPLGARVIDVREAMARHDPSELFFDSVHYTERGGRLFAQIVNEARR